MFHSSHSMGVGKGGELSFSFIQKNSSASWADSTGLFTSVVLSKQVKIKCETYEFN